MCSISLLVFLGSKYMPDHIFQTLAVHSADTVLFNNKEHNRRITAFWDIATFSLDEIG
jgi:hypothetical protein